MVKVINLKTCKDWGKEGDVYIGRGSPWGNPFRIKNNTVAERDRVIDLYEKYIIPKLDLSPLMKARRFGCFCKPKRCHGDSLKKLIELKQEVNELLWC